MVTVHQYPDIWGPDANNFKADNHVMWFNNSNDSQRIRHLVAWVS